MNNITGLIINSYYDSKNKADGYIDVLVRQGNEAKSYAKVPVLRIGGMSTSLPSVGATAFIGFLGDNDEQPFMIGYIDSVTSRKISDDSVTPRKPPTILTR